MSTAQDVEPKRDRNATCSRATYHCDVRDGRASVLAELGIHGGRGRIVGRYNHDPPDELESRAEDKSFACVPCAWVVSASSVYLCAVLRMSTSPLSCATVKVYKRHCGASTPSTSPGRSAEMFAGLDQVEYEGQSFTAG